MLESQEQNQNQITKDTWKLRNKAKAKQKTLKNQKKKSRKQNSNRHLKTKKSKTKQTHEAKKKKNQNKEKTKQTNNQEEQDNWWNATPKQEQTKEHHKLLKNTPDETLPCELKRQITSLYPPPNSPGVVEEERKWIQGQERAIDREVRG